VGCSNIIAPNVLALGAVADFGAQNFNMKTIQEIAQWAIDNRYPKSENDLVSDFEMYHTLIEAMNQVLRQPPGVGCREKLVCPSCRSKKIKSNLCPDNWHQ